LLDYQLGSCETESMVEYRKRMRDCVYILVFSWKRAFQDQVDHIRLAEKLTRSSAR
jgi:hypothetical protein